jgi:hypothetical protein
VVEALVAVVVTPATVDEVEALVALVPLAASEVVVEVDVVLVVDDDVPAPLRELEVVVSPEPTTLPPSMTPVSRSPMKTPAPMMARRARMPRSLLMRNPL